MLKVLHDPRPSCNLCPTIRSILHRTPLMERLLLQMVCVSVDLSTFHVFTMEQALVL